MKRLIPVLCILLFFLAGIRAQEGVKIQDPENYFSKKEKRVFERAIDYEIVFYNRIFPNREIVFSDIKFTVVPNRIEYAMYLKKLGAVTHPNSPGIYFTETHELVVCTDKKYKGSFIKISCHELSHAFLHLHSDDKNLPAWLNEGLAVYLENMTFGKKKIKQHIDNPHIARVKTLIELKDLNLSEFVAWDYRKFSAESFTQEGYGYAVGYCMVLFLMQYDEEKAIAIFRNLIGEQTATEAFNDYYPGGFAQFEKDFMTHFGE
jgi:hypothetical protein